MWLKFSQIEAKEQGEWNGEGDDESGANIEKKQTKDDADQNHSSVRLCITVCKVKCSQIAAIQHGYHLHPGRQDAVVELVDFLVNGLERGFLLGAFARSSTPPWMTSGSSMMRPSSMWLARAMWPNRILGPWTTSAMSFYPKGRTGLGLQNGLLDVVHGVEQPERGARSSAACRPRRSCRRR